jgi:hypothetical protein
MPVFNELKFKEHFVELRLISSSGCLSLGTLHDVINLSQWFTKMAKYEYESNLIPCIISS